MAVFAAFIVQCVLTAHGYAFQLMICPIEVGKANGLAKMYALLLVGCISASLATGCEQKKIPWIYPHLFISDCLPAYD